MSRPLGAILIVSVLGGLVAPAASASVDASAVRRADRHCAAGTKALHAGDYDKARGAFAKAFAAVPDFPPAHLGLGHIALAEQDYELALAEYEKARETWSSFGELLASLEMERWNDAQHEIQRLQDQLREDQRQGSNNVSGEEPTSSSQRMRQSSYEQQIQRLQAIPMPTRDPEDNIEPPADLDFHIGNALFRLGRYEGARTAWETCADKNPSFPLVHNNLAVMYLKEGRYDEARREVADAERLGMKVNPALKEDIERAAAQRE